MKSSIQLVRKFRNYSEEFKKDIVREYEKGKLSVPQLGRLHSIPNTNLYRWIYKYSTFNEKGYRIIEMKKSSTSKLKELEQKIKDLEQKVGQKQIQIDYLETMLEVAKEEMNIDIKKNFGTPQSTKSVSRKKK